MKLSGGDVKDADEHEDVIVIAAQAANVFQNGDVLADYEFDDDPRTRRRRNQYSASISLPSPLRPYGQDRHRNNQMLTF